VCEWDSGVIFYPGHRSAPLCLQNGEWELRLEQDYADDFQFVQTCQDLDGGVRL
jgi:hypothetical protein